MNRVVPLNLRWRIMIEAGFSNAALALGQVTFRALYLWLHLSFVMDCLDPKWLLKYQWCTKEDYSLLGTAKEQPFRSFCLRSYHKLQSRTSSAFCEFFESVVRPLNCIIITITPPLSVLLHSADTFRSSNAAGGQSSSHLSQNTSYSQNEKGGPWSSTLC